MPHELLTGAARYGTREAAPPARTLLAILAETVARHPEAPALDDGVRQLDYFTLYAEITDLAERFGQAGVGRGDRVGVRIPSGSADLYIAILGVLAAGAAYVPVDVDDPEERARLVFGEAEVRAVIGEGLRIELHSTGGAPAATPEPGDDAWIIFTSGSTGTPKGVAVSHRSAAAFVDAEARIFLRNAPLGPGDRVLAGLSVAFDASCEEMWLAWRNGACLVPAPRSLVRSGVDLGPWLVEHRVTAVSTVPTLASLWPSEALDNVRLLIFGGEACPPELAERLAVDGREVWNTYGPTEATVVATAAPLTGEGPVRIGLPLDGWELAVIDAQGEPVAPGESGELVIAGVGLARYLDPEKDAAKYAPLPSVGWERAYRSGDLVRADPEGLVFLGRADEQIKLGGRRIELGEIDAALQALPGVAAAAAAVKGPVGAQVLIGYVVPSEPVPDTIRDLAPQVARARVARSAPAVTPEAQPGDLADSDDVAELDAVAESADIAESDESVEPIELTEPVGRTNDSNNLTKPLHPALSQDTLSHPTLSHEATRGPIPFDPVEARALLSAKLPAALVPRIAVVGSLPTRTSGKVDRNALPWPLPDAGSAAAAEDVVELTPQQETLAEHWAAVLGERPQSLAADFFDAGGGSLAAARFVSVLRAHHPTVTVRDVYDNPSFGALSERLAELTSVALASSALPRVETVVTPVPRWFQLAQTAAMMPLSVIGSVRWLTLLAAAADILAPSWAPHVAWGWIVAGFLLFGTPPGRILVTALGARALLRGLEPGQHPRGGGMHLRLWIAEQLALRTAVVSMVSGPWIPIYARALGARIGVDAVLHSPPPITGMLRLAEGAAIEPEVDLAGQWIDGGTVHVGEIRVGANASVGARSTLLPGARIGEHARIAPGSSVNGVVSGSEHWAGSPAERVGRLSKAERGVERAPYTRKWTTIYSATATVLGLLPLVAALPALALLSAFTGGSASALGAFDGALPGVLPAVVVFYLAFGLLVLGGVRALSIGMTAGEYPLHSLAAWRVWTTTQLMGMAKVWLYPLYASVATPAWLRLLGMKVGRDVELSTVLAVPAMTTVDNGAFLADDTMIAPYELSDGRLNVGTVRIGKRVFVGNSGMVGPGRKLPKGSLVGVLSAAPRKAKRNKSYLGMPPERLRRASQDTDSSLTYNPPRKLKALRAIVELCRIVPAACTAALLLFAAAAEIDLARGLGLVAATLLAGPVILGVGVLGAALATAAKWALVGRIRAEDQPLWSSFVWRNELADNFVELVGAPWFAESWLGTAPLNLWLRSLGSKIGRGVWCETYWLPEADLIVLGEGATVNRGCVVQTHLFHDRVMSMDVVTLHDGATLGPQCVILPAASIGTAATVGPASLVMRGEAVPPRTRWAGNPIAPWVDDEENDV
jgi:non-ribosomal peptide synthetase-like protein